MLKAPDKGLSAFLAAALAFGLAGLGSSFTSRFHLSDFEVAQWSYGGLSRTFLEQKWEAKEVSDGLRKGPLVTCLGVWDCNTHTHTGL